MCTENRVSGNDLRMAERSTKSILDKDNCKCIPDSSEKKIYANLVSCIVVDKISCLKFLKEHVVRHFPEEHVVRHKLPQCTLLIFQI